MGMLPVPIDEAHVVRVKDSVYTGESTEYWLSLWRGDDFIAAGTCPMPWVDGRAPTEAQEVAMARGFAAAVLRRA